MKRATVMFLTVRDQTKKKNWRETARLSVMAQQWYHRDTRHNHDAFDITTIVVKLITKNK